MSANSEGSGKPAPALVAYVISTIIYELAQIMFETNIDKLVKSNVVNPTLMK